MTDQSLDTTVRCPWCSAPLTDPTAPTCPSCGASLKERAEGDVPGVTQVDAAAVVSQSRLRRRSGGLRALIGAEDEDTEGSPTGKLPEPPSEEVRREMLRLRVEALEIELQARRAELEALRVAQAAEAGEVIAPSDAPATPAAPDEEQPDEEQQPS